MDVIYDKVEQYGEEDLTPPDRKTVETVRALFGALLDDAAVDEYVAERKELCDWGKLESLSFREKVQPFLLFLRERADALACAYVVQTVDDYDCESDEKGDVSRRDSAADIS